MSTIFRPLLRGSVFVFSSQFLIKGFSFISFLLITSAFSRQDYGYILLVLSISGPVLVLSGLGLDDIMLSATARLLGEKKPEESRRLFSAFFVMKIVVTTVAVLGVFFSPAVLGKQYAAIVGQHVLVLQCWIIFSSLRTLFDLRLQTYQRFGIYSVANIFESIIKLICVAFFFFTHALTVTTALWAYVFGKAGSTLIAILFQQDFLFLVSIGAGFTDLYHLLRKQGKWEIIRGGFGQLFSGIDMWVIGLIVGLEAVALYGVATTMNSVLSNFLPFRKVVYPILSKISGEQKAGSMVSRRMAKYSFWINAILIGLSIVFVPPIVLRFYPKYIGAIPVFFAIAPTLFLTALSTSHGPLMYARSEQAYLFFLTVITTISSFTILPALAFVLGVYGITVEHFLTSLFMIIMRERRLRQRHGLQTFSLKDLIVFDAIDHSITHRLFRVIQSRLPFARKPLS